MHSISHHDREYVTACVVSVRRACHSGSRGVWTIHSFQAHHGRLNAGGDGGGSNGNPPDLPGPPPKPPDPPDPEDPKPPKPPVEGSGSGTFDANACIERAILRSLARDARIWGRYLGHHDDYMFNAEMGLSKARLSLDILLCTLGITPPGDLLEPPGSR